MPKVILTAFDRSYVGQVDVDAIAERMPYVLFVDPRTFVLAACRGTPGEGDWKCIYNEVVGVVVRPETVDQGPVV